MKSSSEQRRSSAILSQPARGRPHADDHVDARGNLWDRFYRVVKRIPRGRISTYGEIAERAGLPRLARHVGYALSALRGGHRDVPWQRVLGKRGRKHAGISLRDPAAAAVQRRLLLAEGIEFDPLGRASLERFGWQRK